VRWPGTIKAGSLSDEPVYFPDFLPTALALAGAPMAKVDGVDLSSLLQHEGTRLQQRYFYWETFEPEFRQAVRWGNWKAIRLSKGLALELYELKTDPRETRNIAAQHPQIIAQLEAYLAHARVPSVEYP
jgi:arylsulfatase A-like enzyme